MQTDLLADIRVLVTRPAHQAQAFCDMIAEQGGQVMRLPVIEIEAIALSPEMTAVIDRMDKIDFAVFISPNAVEHGLAVLLAHGKIPDKLKLVTIGKASAQKMQQLLGRTADIYPTEQYNSEALLALDSLQSARINNKKIIIFRGQGGRELLAASLKQRGARVDYAEVYRRKKPEPKNSILESIWGTDSLLANSPDIITLTSNEGLSNLVAMLDDSVANGADDSGANRADGSGANRVDDSGANRVDDSGANRADGSGANRADGSANKMRDSYLTQLRQTPLVVVTEKMRLSAQKSGFKNAIMIAAKASNEALLETVLEWAKIRKR